MNRQLLFGAALSTFGSYALWRAAKHFTEDRMADKKEETAADHDTKHQGSTSTEREVFKNRKHEPSVEELGETYMDDGRTATGIKVMPKTKTEADFKREEEEAGKEKPPTLDDGVDSNAPRVDPGHMRNAIGKKLADAGEGPKAHKPEVDEDEEEDESEEQDKADTKHK